MPNCTFVGKLAVANIPRCLGDTVLQSKFQGYQCLLFKNVDVWAIVFLTLLIGSTQCLRRSQDHTDCIYPCLALCCFTNQCLSLHTLVFLCFLKKDCMRKVVACIAISWCLLQQFYSPLLQLYLWSWTHFHIVWIICAALYCYTVCMKCNRGIELFTCMSLAPNENFTYYWEHSTQCVWTFIYCDYIQQEHMKTKQNKDLWKIDTCGTISLCTFLEDSLWKTTLSRIPDYLSNNASALKYCTPILYSLTNGSLRQWLRLLN